MGAVQKDLPLDFLIVDVNAFPAMPNKPLCRSESILLYHHLKDNILAPILVSMYQGRTLAPALPAVLSKNCLVSKFVVSLKLFLT